MSATIASHPSRIASSGIALPPANGSSTRGARPPNASQISARNLASSPPSSRSQWKIPPRVFSFIRSPLALDASTTRPAIRASSLRRPSRLPGSGSSVASNAVRLAANGLRVGQMCSVEMCPCRTFFSWT